MSYRGNTFPIPCNEGGFVDNPNMDIVQPTDMISPTRNLNLNEMGRGKRGGTASVFAYDANIRGSTTNAIVGIYDYRERGGTQKIIHVGSSGDLFSSSTATIKTGMSTETFFDFETFQNTLFVVDGNSIPQTWATSDAGSCDVSDPAASWGAGNYPQWVVKHGRGNSERLWMGGCPSDSHIIFASANGDGKDYSAANVITINIETADGFGIIGAMEFGDRLFCFGKRKTYVINDADIDTANWGYDAAQWEGGAANFRLIVKTPNDMVCMMEDGEIYSVLAAQEYGDYKLASLTKDSFMHRWIKNNVDLSKFNQFHAQYDPKLRALKFFVVRSGQTNIDTALVYFVDRKPNEAWMIHDNQSARSGYSAACSAIVRERAGDYEVYTGDERGRVWKLEQVNKNDNASGYYAGFKTGQLPIENSRVTKNFKRGWLITESKGTHSMTIDWWVDSVQKTQQTVSLAGDFFTLGTTDAVLDEDALAGSELVNKDFPLGDNGRRIQYEVYNSGANQDFFVSNLMTDYRELSKKPAE